MSAPPPPPPPPPPIEQPPVEPEVDEKLVDACRQALLVACTTLEQARCKEAELEASLVFGSSLLRHKDESNFELDESFPSGIYDAWKTLEQVASAATAIEEPMILEPTAAAKSFSIQIPTGQFAKATYNTTLAASLKHSAEMAHHIQTERGTDGATLKNAVHAAKQASPNIWLQLLDERLADLSRYHARHAAAPSSKRQRKIVVDGYALTSCIEQQPSLLFSDEEVMGKYLDLQACYQEALAQLKVMFVTADKAFLYADFLQALASGGLQRPSLESVKLQHRKNYVRLLSQLEASLLAYLERASPLFDPKASVVNSAVQVFEDTWRAAGGAPGWEAKPSEAALVSDTTETAQTINVSNFETAEALAESVNENVLKMELTRLGMKCGGTPLDRAKRLFLTKDTPLGQLPAKVFVKRNEQGAGKNERRVDIARREAIVTALLDQVRPTLEATIRRAERRQTQTIEEQDKEVEEELFGSSIQDQAMKKKRVDGEDTDSDDDDAPIYNPKNVPLDWDGKPIPYWLFKLHGLNHYYPCEICGGESYRGRRNFELHFGDQKHAAGMKSLGIPNTKHFHGITSIDDTRELWKTLQSKLSESQFDNAREEEYEDSHGNVLSRTTYEDLARQGLL
jgi:splicing factor 3A subunit 3